MYLFIWILLTRMEETSYTSEDCTYSHLEIVIKGFPNDYSTIRINYRNYTFCCIYKNESQLSVSMKA